MNANQAGDNLCRFSDEEIERMKADPTKILPREQFLESCGRFHDQIAGTAGVLGPDCMTIAQLEDSIKELLAAFAALARYEELAGGRPSYCWCLFGIGHPSFGDHSSACKRMRELYERLSSR